jgi:hypothetical protein
MDRLRRIDDTDVTGSRGTGRLSQELIAELRAHGLGHAVGATRHHLLVDPRIPYTSHNSSACIAWAAGDAVDRAALVAAAGALLERERPMARSPASPSSRPRRSMPSSARASARSAAPPRPGCSTSRQRAASRQISTLTSADTAAPRTA